MESTTATHSSADPAVVLSPSMFGVSTSVQPLTASTISPTAATALVNSELTDQDKELLQYSDCFTRFPRTHPATKARRPLFVMGAIYRYTFLFLMRSSALFVSSALFFTLLPLAIGLKANATGRKLCQYYCKALLFSLGIQPRYHGTKPILHEPHIFVSNHTSFLDYILLSADKFPHACIMARHTTWPLSYLQNGAMAFLNCTTFDRDSRQERQEAKNTLAKTLSFPEAKYVVFPEGTCVNNTRIVRFQQGAFGIPGAKICPVAISYGAVDKSKEQTADGKGGEVMPSGDNRIKSQRRRPKNTGFSTVSSDSETSEATQVDQDEEDEELEGDDKGWRKDLLMLSDDEDEEEEDEGMMMGPKCVKKPSPPKPDATTSTPAKDSMHRAIAYWDTTRPLYSQLFFLMTRWRVYADCHYLEPKTRQVTEHAEDSLPSSASASNVSIASTSTFSSSSATIPGLSLTSVEPMDEEPAQFAERVRNEIAQVADLKLANFNGRDKKRLLQLMKEQKAKQRQASMDARPGMRPRSRSLQNQEEDGFSAAARADTGSSTSLKVPTSMPRSRSTGVLSSLQMMIRPMDYEE